MQPSSGGVSGVSEQDSRQFVIVRQGSFNPQPSGDYLPRLTLRVKRIATGGCCNSIRATNLKPHDLGHWRDGPRLAGEGNFGR